MHAPRRQALHDGLDQSLHAISRRNELAVSRSCPPSPVPCPLPAEPRTLNPEPTAHASPPPFHLDKLRQRRRHAQPAGVSRVDAADQRLHKPVERLATEAPDDERFETFVGVVAPRPNE